MGLFLLIRLDSISLDHSVPILLDHYRTFQLTTKEDATFAGANVIADKINFDIGKDLNIISLQDESKSEGKSWGAGIDVSANIPGTNQKPGYATPSLNGSYSQDSADSKWVNNQTSIIAENGGSVKVGETLTNVGSIIGSLNSDEKLSIDANKVVVENLKDHDKGENSGIQVSGISKDTLIPQTGIQYGSHDKEQDSNATFVNTEVTKAGKKLDLDELGINTDINKAQVITKDDVVEQIDTVLHTDLLNKEKQKDLLNDLNTIGENSEIIVDSIGTKLNNNKNGDPNAAMGDLEKQSLANITKAVEQVVKNKENLVLSEADRENKEKLKETIKDKYADYGVTDVIIIPDGTQLKGEDGEMHSVNGAFSRDGIVYITESIANGSLKDLNRVVGEEVGEIYAQNNGLENLNNKGQQIGEIFGEKISEGLDTSKSKNNLSSDDIDLTEIVIGGTSRVNTYYSKDRLNKLNEIKNSSNQQEVIDYYYERFGSPSAGSEYNSKRAALKNVEDTVTKNLSGDQNSQINYYNQLYTEVFKPNGVILYIQDETTGKYREVRNKTEVERSLAYMLEEINKEASKAKSVKDKISIGATVGGYIPQISMPSTIIGAIVDNIPDGTKLSRVEIVTSISKGIVENKLSNNKILRNSFNNLDRISTNPNSSGYKNEFSNNAKNIMNIYYNTYKPFVR